MSRERKAPERVPHFDEHGNQVDVVLPGGRPPGGLTSLPRGEHVVDVYCSANPAHLVAVLIPGHADASCRGLLQVDGAGPSPRAITLAVLTDAGFAPAFVDHELGTVRVFAGADPTIRKLCSACGTQVEIVATALTAAAQRVGRGKSQIVAGVAR